MNFRNGKSDPVAVASTALHSRPFVSLSCMFSKSKAHLGPLLFLFCADNAF